MRNNWQNFLSIVYVFLFPALAFSQQSEKVFQGERQVEEEKILRERIEETEEAPAIGEETPVPASPVSGDEKAFIQDIVVSGVTLVPNAEVNAAVAPFKNRELTLSEMQQAVDAVTNVYRGHGFVTSRAYLPPQKIERSVLEILAIEGKTGDVQVRGNKYFKTEAIVNGLDLQKGEAFNYNDMRSRIARLNRHPDRTVKATLAPGKETGSTDIIVDVTDRNPVHLRLDWDNYGSRYVRKDRYTGVVSHNNLLGRDDMFSLQYTVSDAEDYQLLGMRYLLPVAEKTKVGFSASRSKLSLGREYTDLEARGKSRLYGIFLTQELARKDNLDISFTTGFDYLDSFNFQSGSLQSRDRLRMASLGFDIDYADNWSGRTIVSPEARLGIPDIMGGMDDQDPMASRSGSGGKFIKYSGTLVRLQKLPLASALLWKNEAQTSPYILPASQQFQIGGISNVRGYPSGEFVGDEGIASTFELVLPPFGLAGDVKVPYSAGTLRDALSFAVFYDWGWVSLRNPQPGEEKSETLRGAGIGLRFNLPEDFSFRLDFAWPLGRTPSDGDHFHPWMLVSKEF